MTAPCGVPASVSDQTPSSITPAFSHFWMRRRTLGSAIRFSSNWTSFSFEMLIEKALQIQIENLVHPLPLDRYIQRVQRHMLAPSRPKSVRESPKVLFVDTVEDRHHCLLDDLILQRRDAQWPLLPIGLRYGHSP